MWFESALDFFSCFCNCNRSFFTMHTVVATQMHLILFPPKMFYAWQWRSANPASAKNPGAEFRCIKFRRFLFIGFFQSFAIFNCQSSRMEMKLSFRHKCTSRRIRDIVFMSHNNVRYTFEATWSDWFKSAINKTRGTKSNAWKVSENTNADIISDGRLTSSQKRP